MFTEVRRSRIRISLEEKGIETEEEFNVRYREDKWWFKVSSHPMGSAGLKVYKISNNFNFTPKVEVINDFDERAPRVNWRIHGLCYWTRVVENEPDQIIILDNH